MRIKLTWSCVLGCAGIAGMVGAMAAAANTPEDANPYSVISDRNVFHLNPPPPPPAPPEPKPLDLPKVMLTGFVGKGSSVKVLLAIPPAKDSKDNMYYASLTPGQKEDGVELVSIRLEKEEVDIINAGTAQTLSVKSNSYMATASAPPAGKGGPPGMPGPIGLRHPGFGGPHPFQPPAPAPSAAASSSEGGSSIVAGGGGGNGIVSGGSGNYGSSSGALVSGGYQPQPAASGNNVNNQIANALFSPTTGRPNSAVNSVAPLPPEAQPAAMILQKAAMGGAGPPLPPQVQAELDAAGGGFPPPP